MYKSKMKNFSYLSMGQMFTYIFPLIIYPYLIKTIGLEKFGYVMFVLASTLYIQVLVEYGFTLIAVKDISKDKKNSNKIINSIIYAKFILFLAPLIIYILVFIFSSLVENKLIYIFSLGIVLGDILFLKWVFQAYEDMKYIVIFQFISKLIFLILVLIIVKTEQDYQYVILSQAIGQITIGLLSCLLVIKKYSLHITYPNFKNIKYYFIEAWPLFISNFIVKIYNATNTIILGWISGNSAVGIYTILEKVIYSISQLIGTPFNQVVYPQLSRIVNNIEKMKELVKKYIVVLSLTNIIIGACLFFTSPFIIYFFMDSYNEEAIKLLKLFAIVVPLVPLGSFFSQILVILNQNKKVLLITFKTMIANFIILIPLVLLYDILGIVLTFILVKIYHVYLQISYYKKVTSL